MILNILKVKNFGSIKSANVKFRKGFNLLSGDTGQGKSTLISAIDYSIRKAERKLPDMISWGQNVLSSELDLEHDGKKIFVSGNISSKGKTSTHTRKLVVDKNEYDSLDEISSVLSSMFDPSLCGAALLSKQGETELIKATPAERKAILQKVYDLDFKNQIADLDATKKELEESIQEYQNRILVLESKEYQVMSLEEIPYSEKETDSFKKEIEEIQKEIEEYRQSVKAVERIKNELQDIESEVSRYENKVSSKKKEIDQSSLFITSLEKDCQVKQDEFESMVWDAKLKSLKEKLESLPSLKRIATKEDNTRDLYDALKDVNSDLKIAKEKYAAVQKGECPTCKRPYETSDIEFYKNKCEDLQGKSEEAQKAYEDYKKEIDEYNQAVENNKQIKSDREGLEKQIESESENMELRKKSFLQDIESIRQKIENEKSKIESSRLEQETLQKEMDAVVLKLESKKKEFEGADVSSIDVDKLEGKKEELLQFIKQVEDVLVRNEQAEKHNGEIEKAKKQDKVELSKVKKDRDSILGKIDSYILASTILKKDFPNYVISKMIGDIEIGINDFVDRAYEGRYEIKMVDGRSGIEMLYGPELKTVNYASGGEQQIFEIAARVAYAKLAGFSVLILDEAFAMLNKDLEIKCFEALNSMLEDGTFSQIVLITHQEEVKDFLSINYNAHVIEVKDGEAKEAG